jgi:hypothetical protein
MDGSAKKIHPEPGDPVWNEARHRDLGRQPNGVVIEVLMADDCEQLESEVIVQYFDDSITETIELEQFEGNYESFQGGTWMIHQ